MPSGFNAFPPEALTLAESVLNEVWATLPEDVRSGPGALILRERMARHVLAAMSNGRNGRDEVKASLIRANSGDWPQT
jgi:hypothetical protein